MQELKPKLASNVHMKPIGENEVIAYDETDFRFFRMNMTGMKILELCDGKRTVKEIVDKISRDYEKSLDLIGKDVQEFLSELQKRKMIEWG